MPSRFLHNETDLDAALAILTAGDVRLARLIEVAGRPALRRRPAGDLALQEAARLAFGLKRRPTGRDMVKLAEEWRPWRGVAAHVLWNYYRAIKRRDPVPAQAQIA